MPTRLSQELAPEELTAAFEAVNLDQLQTTKDPDSMVQAAMQVSKHE